MKSASWFIGIFLVFSVLAGCGTSTAIHSTPINTPTSTPTAIPTVDPAFVSKACGSDFAKAGSFGQVGDLIFTQAKLDFLSYPGIKLPDDIPTDRPYQVAATPNQMATAGPNDIASNPSLGSGASGYSFMICNSSSTHSHLLQSLEIKIATFVSDTSSVPNVTGGCTMLFSSKGRQGSDSGCGGSTGGSSESFKAIWPATVSTGTTSTTVVQIDNEKNSPASDPSYNPSDPTILYGNFPVTLQGGKIIKIYVGMDYPSQAGTYTFAVGIGIDNAPIHYPEPAINTKPVFLAKKVHVWGSEACTKYSNQIPSDGPEKFYVCP
jgi:hypothetical protein